MENALSPRSFQSKQSFGFDEIENRRKVIICIKANKREREETLVERNPFRSFLIRDVSYPSLILMTRL